MENEKKLNKEESLKNLKLFLIVYLINALGVQLSQSP